MTQERAMDADLVRAAGQRPRLKQTGTVAVSYTHLRAHETVLDLVCRLLLEKTNTNKPHTAI